MNNGLPYTLMDASNIARSSSRVAALGLVFWQ